MEERKFSEKRIKNMMLMLAATAGLAAALPAAFGFAADQILISLFLGILFFLLFVLTLVHARISGSIAGYRAVDYRLIRNVYLLFCVLNYGFSFLPEYTAPVVLIPIFLSVVSAGLPALAAGICFDILLCITVHANFYELCAYVFLSVAGCVFAELLKEKKNYIGILVILPCIEIVTAALFHYLADYTFDQNTILYAGAGGLITDLLILLLFGKIKQYALTGKDRSLDAIMQEDYPLLAEIRKYAKADYTHAKKVSELCERCAPLIGANPGIAKAAGFYYRLGKIEGETPYVENGVLIAQSNCFPQEVVSILAEYNGEQALPSTRESALVHMVEALVTKFEILDKNTVASTWNYEVVIYQTMNETSSTGIYDESGLTMNQFLKIREFFVKGENLF